VRESFETFRRWHAQVLGCPLGPTRRRSADFGVASSSRIGDLHLPVVRAVRRPHLVEPLPRLLNHEPALGALDLEQPPRLLLRPAPAPRPVQRRVRERPHHGEDRRHDLRRTAPRAPSASLRARSPWALFRTPACAPGRCRPQRAPTRGRGIAITWTGSSGFDSQRLHYRDTVIAVFLESSGALAVPWQR
jgi:hypothetical protein